MENSSNQFGPLRTHREIADLLGIGRGRVFNLEQDALRKLRTALADVGVSSLYDFSAVPTIHVLEPPAQNLAGKVEPFSPAHGWLSVSRIVSINDGSVDALDVARAYQFLKERHDTLMRPPVIVRSSGVHAEYVIQAAKLHEGVLHIRCWPQTKHHRRSVAHLIEHPCTVVVESEFSADERGHFDIPIMVCAVVSEPKKFQVKE